jgi:acyl-CoA synthetase (AMP-forming)/AMP-acid ligase II
VDLARDLIQRINVGDSLTRSAAARPAQLAVVDGPRRWSYAEFNGWVNQIAHGLAERGYGRGDALGLASANSAEFLAVYYACAKLGLVCVPINRGWRPDEVAYVTDQLIRRCLDGFGCDFALLFGQTEMSPVTTLFRPEHQLSHIGAVGTPITGVQVAIMGPDGELLPPGEQGEIVYRGPSTMSEYLHNEEATAAAFAHGWFHSAMRAGSARTGCSGSPTATRT